MIPELDPVALTVDLPEHHLKIGDVGTVVLVHKEGQGYTVEFVSLNGKTLAIVTLHAEQVRALHDDEIAHARALDIVLE